MIYKNRLGYGNNYQIIYAKSGILSIDILPDHEYSGIDRFEEGT
jgi:hypothetical protein